MRRRRRSSTGKRIDYNGLVAYYSLGFRDANGTTINDLSGNNNTGTSAETPTFTTDQNGVPNQAMVLDGTDYADCGSGINVTGGNYTISAWVNSTVGNKDIIGSGGITGGDFLLLMESGGHFRGHSWTDSNANSITGTKSINDGNWHFVTQVVDATKIYIFVDGLLDNSANLIGNKTGGTGCIIGCRNNNTSTAWEGNLSDIAIYNVAKSADWVAQQYKAG